MLTIPMSIHTLYTVSFMFLDICDKNGAYYPMFECWVCIIHGTVLENKLNQKVREQQLKVLDYDKREYWPILNSSAYNESADEFSLITPCIYYGMPIISGGIQYIMSDIFDSKEKDYYGLKWYEYFGVIGLIFTKHLLQFMYVYGDKYDEEAETQLLKQIEITNNWNGELGILLRSKVGNELSKIVFEFLYQYEDNLKNNNECDWSATLICCICNYNQ